jgi:dTMP kinase
MSKGFFITFEGGEGVGKSTQIAHLSKSLKEKGINTVQTREPGGTPQAEAIRNLLCSPEYSGTWTNESELLMYSAARSQHVHDVVLPALDKAQTVLCDRYVDSTCVYQGIVQGLPEELMNTVIKHSALNVFPDLTFILDLSAAEGLKRVRSRGIRDHYDDQDENFYEQIRQGFLTIAKENPDRCVIIDAQQDEQAIAKEIETLASERLYNV